MAKRVWPCHPSLLIVSYEVSGTTSVYTLVPAPGAGALMLGAGGLLARRRR